MKTTRILLLIGAVLAAASVAHANQIKVGYIGPTWSTSSLYGPYRTGGGGEFTLNDIHPDGWLDLSGYVDGKTKNFGPSGISSFQSFSIEKSESLLPWIPYDAQLNTKAVNGGVGPAGDPISKGTGWLYSQFARGVLAGYSYDGTSPSRKSSASLLQKAIWWLEGESHGFSASNPFMVAVVANFGTKAEAKSDGGAAYGVSALNLTINHHWDREEDDDDDDDEQEHSYKKRGQDQLFYKPVGVPQAAVPDGGSTVVMLGAAFFVMAMRRKTLRFRSAKQNAHSVTRSL